MCQRKAPDPEQPPAVNIFPCQRPPTPIPQLSDLEGLPVNMPSEDYKEIAPTVQFNHS